MGNKFKKEKNILTWLWDDREKKLKVSLEAWFAVNFELFKRKWYWRFWKLAKLVSWLEYYGTIVKSKRSTNSWRDLWDQRFLPVYQFPVFFFFFLLRYIERKSFCTHRIIVISYHIFLNWCMPLITYFLKSVIKELG